jgi:hypothetical protein
LFTLFSLRSDYLNLRLEVIDPAKTKAAVARSEKIQGELWMLAEELAREAPLPTVSLYTLSVNQVMDLHTERLNAELGFQVPLPIIFGLLGISVLTLLLIGINDGYHECNNRWL